MTTTTYLTPKAADALIIRPSDQPALAALRQLACQNGAHVQRGTISLAGARWSAWLAFSRDGRLLVVVLLDAAECNSGSPRSSDSPPHSACTDAAHARASGAQGVSPDDHR